MQVLFIVLLCLIAQTLAGPVPDPPVDAEDFDFEVTVTATTKPANGQELRKRSVESSSSSTSSSTSSSQSSLDINFDKSTISSLGETPGNLTFTISIENTEDVDAEDVVVEVKVITPNGVLFVSADVDEEDGTFAWITTAQITQLGLGSGYHATGEWKLDVAAGETNDIQLNFVAATAARGTVEVKAKALTNNEDTLETQVSDEAAVALSAPAV
eukprot:CAMPEP_0168596068 /NCGR_PEP_ID=MMETSP0420-20121227/9823_1 /TAXON_ID=498008 /ORGANISM="Pessonella sp." /LENGTH=213 /DNA_ID=CAMNT_0008632607 /DNA_START=42 /DNA_END=679 /DNA_ORIENTATION=+